MAKYPDDPVKRAAAMALGSNKFKGANACQFVAMAFKTKQDEEVVVKLSKKSVLTHSQTCPIANGKVKMSMLTANNDFRASLAAAGNKATLKSMKAEASKSGMGGTGANKDLVYRAQRTVRKEELAAYDAQFQEIPGFLKKVMTENPGTYTKVETSPDGTFRCDPPPPHTHTHTHTHKFCLAFF